MNEEPKKRSVRRAVVKKAVVLPVSQAKAPTKKVPIKKAVVKKAVAKKIQPPTSTSPSSTPTRKRAIKSPFSDEVMAEVTETNSDPETVKMLTGPLSPRLKEKLALYELWYRTESPRYAEGVAKVFGYTFIITGFLLAFALTTSDTFKEHGLMATLECSLSNCPELTATTTDVAVALVLPTVSFVTTPIVVPNKDTDVTITVANATDHQFSIISQDTGAVTVLTPAGNDGAGMFMYRVPTRELSPGDYEIRVRSTASDGATKTEFIGGTIVVPPGNETPLDSEITPMPVSETAEPATTTESTDTEISSTSTAEVTEFSDESERGQVLGLSTDTEETVEVANEAKVEPKPVLSSPTDEVMVVTVSPGILDNQYKVLVVPTYEYSTVELSIRAENSTTALYLGQANLVKNGWLYWFDASALPTGNYRLIISGLEDGDVKDSTELRFENERATPLYLTSPEYEEVKRALVTEVEKLASATTSELSTFVDSRTDFVPELIGITPGINHDSAAATLTLTYAAKLNPLLRHYASARQSGDETALRLATEQIDKLITNIINTEVTDGAESVFSLESELRVIIDQLKERITSIESYKNERTAAASSVDTDEDGIADYDEYLLYATDPKEADTDNDGVTDGVEIAQGYDPSNASPEAVVRLSEPSQVAYVDDSVLSITAVTPLLVYEVAEVEPLVQSEISGYGLPNSFVTLFISALPTVVVVKTDDAGKFSYTFTKILEDGIHDVYAALVDNTGTIVLRSSAFRFAKTGSSYTYPKESPLTAAVASVPSFANASASYNLVATMGVVAFGLILLLMALALRQDRLKPIPNTTP